MTSERRKTRLALVVLGGSLTWVGVSCAFLTPPGSAEEPIHALAFNHEAHAEADIACMDCHIAENGEPSMPALAVCLDCHEEDPEEEEPAIVDFIAGIRARPEGSPWVLYTPNEELIFAHKNHSEQECSACHGDVAGSTATGRWVKTTMNACVECHEEAAPEHMECSSCHKEIRRDVPPASHHGAWEQVHGDDARFGDMDGMLSGTCSNCHTRDSCMECHRQVQPRSHNNFFRIRGHGLLAGNDRQSCAACHKPDSCVRCHENTVPISHRGSFGAPGNKHCFGCHLPTETGSSCGTCHQTAPSHALAPPRPSGHRFLSLDCRSCHGLTASLKHPDPGANCLACHQ